jgi:hypothetical protein
MEDSQKESIPNIVFLIAPAELYCVVNVFVRRDMSVSLKETIFIALFKYCE